MTIKIKRVFIEKDSMETQNKDIMQFGVEKLKGKFKVQLTEGKVHGNAEVKIGDVSEELQDELYKVLNKIEDELNGVVAEGSVESNNAETVDESKHAWENLNINETATQNITVSITVKNKEDINQFVSEIIKNLKRRKGLK